MSLKYRPRFLEDLFCLIYRVTPFLVPIHSARSGKLNLLAEHYPSIYLSQGYLYKGYLYKGNQLFTKLVNGSCRE